MGYKTKTWNEIISDKIDKSKGLASCWEWQKALDKHGYGFIARKIPGTQKNKGYRAHRIAYEVYVGPIPAGISVLHKCDNRKCCNPQHLFLGTAADNNRDARNKGRAILNARKRISDNTIAALRNAFDQGGQQIRSLAKQFGVSETHAHRLIKNRQ